jgi:hypothetical protein
MAELMTASTGWEITIADVQQIGERRLNLIAPSMRAGRRPHAIPCPSVCSTSR